MTRDAAALDRLTALAERVRPAALARERTLPVVDALSGVLPEGLPRGASVGVASTCARATGSTSLALAVLAGPSSAGSWTAAVGVPSLGLGAAAGFGVDLGRLVLVAAPPMAQWATVVATLLDAFDVVVARPPGPGRVPAGIGCRLTARARERGSVLVRLGPTAAWPEAADVSLTVVATAWEGLGDGHGHLRARRAVVEVSGRRGYARPRQVELWL
ncbi:MAG: hypothetical protein ACRD0G_04880, partial [Acidimicrobiales bacterium]